MSNQKDKNTEIGRSFASLLAGLGTFAFTFLALKFHFLVAGLIAVGVYSGVYLMSKPVPKIGGFDAELLSDGEDAMAVLDEGKEHLRQIRLMAEQIKDPEYQRLVVEAQRTAASLTKYLEQNPAKISKARKFLTYQLALTEETVQDYQEVKSVGIGLESEKMQAFDEQSKNIMGILKDSFEEQFELLVEDKMLNMDIQNEILESKIKAEKRVIPREE